MAKNLREFTLVIWISLTILFQGCTVKPALATIYSSGSITPSGVIDPSPTYILTSTRSPTIESILEVKSQSGIEIEMDNNILIATSEGIKDNYYLYSINSITKERICISCEMVVIPSSNYDKFWSPIWAPDGNSYSIGFIGMPLDGIILRQENMPDKVLISGENAWYNNLTWSPGGQYITFSRNNNLDDRVDVCFINIFGNAPNEKCAPLVEDNKVNTNPTWSQDGKSILFTSAGDKYRFYMWNIEDNSVTQFTDINGDDLFGKWSPDGSKFAYILGTRVSESGFIPYQYDLYIADADGSNGQIVPNTSATYDFDWSPDGKKIVFTQRSPIENESCEVGCLPFTVLKIMDLETGEITTLTDGTEWIGDPAWRP